MNTFAAANLHISLAAEPVFYIGNFAVTNALIMGCMGLVATVGVCFYVRHKVVRGEKNKFTGLFEWAFELLLNQVNNAIPDRKLARKIAPLAITIFLFVLFNYWLSVLPGVGSVSWNGVPIFRALVADVNFTVMLAVVTMIAVQVFAVRQLGLIGNAGRYFRNPLKDPIGAFEGILELIGEFSRGIALALRLFGNAFAGEVLLMLVAALAGAISSLILPLFMAFELFIGFIQAYVFFMLTLIFTSLAVSHGHDHDDNHSSAAVVKNVPQLE
ncbi:MAG TPA: F0F1 ATP synthase subunit A [Candidatus Saccharibacteria bacterium]|nr:F0F1 ATP synthase subunit A [Candidatus Saccharibacteria bacterium]